MEVAFMPMTTDDALAIWQAAHDDEAWPLLFRRCDGFVQFVKEYDVSQLFHEGCLETIWVDGIHAGYHTVHRISEQFVESELHAVECGTWLLSSFRGRGVNTVVKSHAIRLAAKQLGALHCVFAISVGNERAIRGLRGLRLPWIEVRRGDDAVFDRFIRRKEWETGEKIILFVLDIRRLEPAESGCLLEPTGNE